jgi:hypothetical protein
LTTIRDLKRQEREETLERVLHAFIIFCRQNFGFELYEYEVKIAYWCLYSLLVEPVDVYIKIARQAGKTETITLLLRFLIIFYRLLAWIPTGPLWPNKCSDWRAGKSEDLRCSEIGVGINCLD